MSYVDGVGCTEDLTTWVPSGVYLGRASVPAEVAAAPPVRGLHLVHVDAGLAAPEAVGAVAAQSVSVAARSVNVPPASVVADLDLEGAKARADEFHMPVYLPRGVLTTFDHFRVLPIGALGLPAGHFDAAYVLVLPKEHVLAKHPGVPLGAQLVAGPVMPGAVRWLDGRAEVGLPQPIVNARFGHLGGAAIRAARPGQIRQISGGVIGLWRELAGLTPGQAMLVSARDGAGGGIESPVAIRLPDGIALVHDTPAGVRAATLPDRPSELSVVPVSVPSSTIEFTGAARDSVHHGVRAALTAEELTTATALGPLPVRSVVLEWLAGINPWLGIGGDFVTNCVLAAIGVDMVLQARGSLRVQVPPSEPLSLTYLENYANDTERGVRRPEGGFGFVQTTIGEVRRALDASPVWERGIVAVSGAPGGLRHVVNAVRLHDGPALIDGQTRRAVTIADNTTVWFLPLSDGIRIGLPSVAAADVGAAHAGAAGIEVETRTRLDPPAGLTWDQIWELGPLAQSPHAKIVIDRYRQKWIFEIVTHPAQVSAQETVGRITIDAAIADVRAALNALANGAGKSLQEALRGSNFEVTAAGAGITVLGTTKPLDTATLSTHYTVGVPLAYLYQFMVAEFERRSNSTTSSARAHAESHHAQSLMYAAKVVCSYGGVPRLEGYEAVMGITRDRNPGTRAMAGFLALAYTQVAAVISGSMDSGSLPKNFTMIASRTALSAVRAALPSGIRGWLEANADNLATDLVEYYDSMMHSSPEGCSRRAKRHLARTVEKPDRSGVFRVSDYLSSIFAADAPLIDQNQALEIRTHMTTLDDGHEKLESSPLVVVELRRHHASRPTLAELEEEFRSLVRRVGDQMDSQVDRTDIGSGSAFGTADAGVVAPVPGNARLPNHQSDQDEPLTEDVILPPGNRVDAPESRLYWVGSAPSQLLSGEIRKAAVGFGGPVIFLGGARDANNVRDVRRLVQQFALKQQQPVLVTRDNPEPLHRMAATYGISIVHPVAKPKATASGGPPTAALDPVWRVTGGDGTTEDMGATFTSPLLTSAAAHAKRATTTTSRALAKLLLAPDRATKLELLTTHHEELTSQRARDDLATIVHHTGSDTWFRKTAPLLGELGAPDKATFVLDYQEAHNPVERDHLLIDAPGRGIDVDLRIHLIDESGHSTAGAVTVMYAIDLTFTDGLPAALKYVTQHSTNLPATSRQRWVDAIVHLAQGHDTHKQTELRQLAARVLEC
ncbi:hypothetical protein ACLQ24_06225 [Micromonospora sp. DT4]|uniref:hypothetical protein n=1 Tax=Micromonospora sp. DT4 TaxID=3393438 RepID=UPI003CF53C75